MASNSKEVKDRAEAVFKKKQRQAEGTKATAEYEAEGRVIAEKTTRLRSLRLAKEAAEIRTKPVTAGKKPSHPK